MEGNASIWALIGALVAIGISIVGAVMAAQAKKRPVTLETVKESIPPLQAVIKEAEGWVAVAQYLWEKGEIPEVDGVKDPRFYFVADKVKPYVPGVDEQTLEYGVEAAVKIVKPLLAKALGGMAATPVSSDGVQMDALHVKQFAANV